MLEQETASSLKKRRVFRPARDPKKSLWWDLYIESPELTPIFKKEFRNAFRMPYDSFLLLVKDAKHENWFPREKSVNSAGRPSSPLELLILGSLRYLGRGFTFSGLWDVTFVRT